MSEAKKRVTCLRVTPRTSCGVHLTKARFPNRATGPTSFLLCGVTVVVAALCGGIHTGAAGPPSIPAHGFPVRRDCLQITHMQLSRCPCDATNV